jgi:hypothetical protein
MKGRWQAERKFSLVLTLWLGNWMAASKAGLDPHKPCLIQVLNSFIRRFTSRGAAWQVGVSHEEAARLIPLKLVPVRQAAVVG